MPEEEFFHIAAVLLVAVSTCPELGAVALDTLTVVVADLRPSAAVAVPAFPDTFPVALPMFGVVNTGLVVRAKTPVPLPVYSADVRW